MDAIEGHELVHWLPAPVPTQQLPTKVIRLPGMCASKGQEDVHKTIHQVLGNDELIQREEHFSYSDRER